MPRKLREHFLDLERQLVQHLIWKKDTPVVKHIEDMIEKQNKDQQGILDNNSDNIGETFAQMERRKEQEEKSLRPLKVFFNRVLQMAA